MLLLFIYILSHNLLMIFISEQTGVLIKIQIKKQLKISEIQIIFNLSIFFLFFMIFFKKIVHYKFRLGCKRHLIDINVTNGENSHVL